ncbi:uncharacterized protein J3R85_006593 [Psidium guajava]|nr:uncharacterized protein J3R85_006593 [Psidium guajava]
MKTSLSSSPSTMPPDLELPKIKVPSSSVAAVDHEASGGGGSDVGAIQIASGYDDESECRTPTSSEHRIQAAATCPPAPRKPRATPSRKRSHGIFDAVNRDEVEGFFRSCELALRSRGKDRGAVMKRRYLSKGVVVSIL